MPFESLMEKKGVEIKTEEDIFVITKGNKDNRFLVSLADAFNSKGLKVSKTHKLEKRIPFEKLELAYRLDELAARCVNFYALQVISPDFEFINCKKETKDFLNDFKERTHLMEKLEDIFRDLCIYGNGWLEKKFNDTRFVDIDYINGKYMDFQRDSFEFVREDDFGNIIGYVWKDWTGNKIELNPNQIAHFKLFGHGNELAFGFIEPLYHLIYDKINARKGISQAGWRAGHELLVAYIGDKPDSRIGYPGHKADSSFAEQLADELEDIKGKHKLVLPHWAKIEKIKGETIDWSPLLNYFDSRICAGFGIPIEIASGIVGKSNRATLEVAITRDLDRTIKSFQNKISHILKECIFSELKLQGDIEEIPKIRWNDITPIDLNRRAKRMTEYKQTGVIQDSDLDNIREVIFDEEKFTLSKKKIPEIPKEEKPKETIPVKEEPEKEKMVEENILFNTLNSRIDKLIQNQKLLIEEKNTKTNEYITRLIEAQSSEINAIKESIKNIDIQRDNTELNKRLKIFEDKFSEFENKLSQLKKIKPKEKIIIKEKEIKIKPEEKLEKELPEEKSEKKEKINTENIISILQVLKTSFPGFTIVKLIDSLIENLMKEITGHEIQQGTGIDKTQELSEFVFEKKHLSIEEAIIFLEKLKNIFPQEKKIIDSLIEQIKLKNII